MEVKSQTCCDCDSSRTVALACKTSETDEPNRSCENKIVYPSSDPLRRGSYTKLDADSNSYLCYCKAADERRDFAVADYSLLPVRSNWFEFLQYNTTTDSNPFTITKL